jgi:hypothetical protein
LYASDSFILILASFDRFKAELFYESMGVILSTPDFSSCLFIFLYAEVEKSCLVFGEAYNGIFIGFSVGTGI